MSYCEVHSLYCYVNVLGYALIFNRFKRTKDGFKRKI